MIRKIKVKLRNNNGLICDKVFYLYRSKYKSYFIVSNMEINKILKNLGKYQDFLVDPYRFMSSDIVNTK